METKHKTFKPFDKVLVRNNCRNNEWVCDLYSNFSKDTNVHYVIGDGACYDNDILSYEGNEHLVGTADEPEEEVKLEKGEFVMCASMTSASTNPLDYEIAEFVEIIDGYDSIKIKKSNNIAGSTNFIKFSDFNPNDMKETRKHILCVKNGKIVKYKE